MRYDPATDHYVPVDSAEAFALIGHERNALDDPNKAEFYTLGAHLQRGGVHVPVVIPPERIAGSPDAG